MTRVSFGNVVIGLATSIIVPITASADTIYVDANVTGPKHDGMSWCTAYAFLQDALDAAKVSGGAITEIRLADGAYKPDQGASQTPGNQAATFQLLDGVTIAGGYAGCGANDPDLRDVAAHQSVLSCDLLGDDAANFPFDLSGRYDNCWHVVTASGTDGPAILDGFTITGGWAVDRVQDDSDEWGGGMLNLGGRPTLRSCTFTRNVAIAGSSMYNANGARPIVTGCTFINNRADKLGDVVNLSATSASFEECTFIGFGIPAPFATRVYGTLSSTTFTKCEFRSFGGIEGGAVWSEQQEIVFLQCVFEGNQASDRGGAIYLRDPQRALFTDCLFRQNHSLGGGAIYMEDNVGTGTVTFRRCEFLNNEARDGGAIAIDNLYENDLVFSQCNFTDNRASLGGGVHCDASFPTFEGCLFRDNHAQERGGGIYFDGNDGAVLFNTLIAQNVSERGDGGGIYIHGTNTVLTNCSIINNSATQRLGFPILPNGGGIFNEDSSPTLTNCILWGNRDSGGADESAQMFSDATSMPVVYYTAIQGLDQLIGTGNIGDAPLFSPGPGGCYYLSQPAAGQATDSPCVDSGNGTVEFLGLDQFTTRSDESTDTATVDMGYHYRVIGQPLIAGDYDRNLLLDLADVSGLQMCFTGPGPTDVSPCCRIFDFDADGDVDLEDSTSLVTTLDGP